MTRAALLQCPGDPFIIAYWLRNCERVWRDEVDQLDVFVNGQGDPEVLAEIARRAAALDARLTHQPGRLVHGQATRRLVEACEARTVLLIEDDAFVRERGAVGSALAAIEDGETDVIGTPRGGMDPQIEAYALARWGHLYSPEGNQGPGIWPCFVFARLEDLRATSRVFESRTWRVGERIPGLDYLVTDRDQHTDSFTTTAFELRAAGLRIRPCVQYKELWNRVLPESGAPWFHAGGLSNGEFLTGRWDWGGARPFLQGTNEGRDWAHRIWWWRRILDSTPDVLPHRRADYRRRLERLVEYTGVGEMVEEWEETQPAWISWNDQP